MANHWYLVYSSNKGHRTFDSAASQEATCFSLETGDVLLCGTRRIAAVRTSIQPLQHSF
jgi:hypothetical protein